MSQNIILIGFMGAGKTSVGNYLAGKTGMQLVDTDQMIEEKAGMKISDIFALKGEACFRELETSVLEMLTEDTKARVISVGGGLPLREENRNMLKRLGKTVYLSVMPETVVKRLKGDDTRPLLKGDHVEEKVRAMLEERGPVYEMAADKTVSTDHKTLEEIAKEIIG